MAFALTKIQCYGIEAEEAVNKRYQQKAILTITGLNTDVDMDLGDLTTPGTFWSAADGTATGLKGLAAFRDIAQRAQSFVGIGGSTLAPYVQADASVPALSLLDSAVSAGGAANETLTVTGLLTTDVVISARMTTEGANNVAVKTFAKACAIAGQYAVEWTADPGAGAIVTLAIQRASTTVAAGTYQLTMDSTYTNMPNILFLSGDAPTAYVLELSWVLKPQEQPVELYAEA